VKKNVSKFFRKSFNKLSRWKLLNISQKHFVLILSVLVGIFSGLAVVTIKNTVYFIQKTITLGLAQPIHKYLYMVYPLMGILITVWIIQRIIKSPVHSGIPFALFSISKRNSIIRRFRMFSSAITSIFTVGFGGSAGLEGPSVMTSAAIGSNIGRAFKVNYKVRTLLIGCAATASLAAIFKAPVAAIVFAIEVIMLDLTTASLVPLLLASVSAAIISGLIMGDDVLFHFQLVDKFEISDTPFYLFLGVVAGIFSLYFSKIYLYLITRFKRFKNPYKRALIGGILMGGLLLLFPPLYGEGYDIVNAILDGKGHLLTENTLFETNNIYLFLVFLVLVLFFKALATSFTIGSGGVGGIFAPTLFMGSVLGFTFSRVLNEFGFMKVSESNFTLVGMAGLMAGVLHAPLTAIFLIAEITGGYELFIPLMFTSAIAFVTVKAFMPHSIYTIELAKRGELITHHKDKAVLTLMRLEREIEKDFLPINPNATLGELVNIIARSKRNLFPVLSARGTLVGIITLDQVRDIMFDKSLYDEVLVDSLMEAPPEQVQIDDTMDIVLEKFERCGAWNLPVIDKGKYVGFVSKSKLFSAYRNLLLEFSEE
jgi:CIC family chloride channel protein